MGDALLGLLFFPLIKTGKELQGGQSGVNIFASGESNWVRVLPPMGFWRVVTVTPTRVPVVAVKVRL